MTDFAIRPDRRSASRRKEDYRFLTGAGQYTDDVALPQPDLRRVRALAARARAHPQRSTSTRRRRRPACVAVFTGADLAAAKVGGLPCGWLITDVNGQPMKEPPHPVLAQGKVRHVGDQVAVVVAETLAAGARRRRAGRGRLRACCRRWSTLREAAATAPARARRRARQHLLRLGARRQGAVDAAFAKAAHVTKLDFVNNRLIPNAIEPRAANARVHARATTSYTLYVANQNPHVERLLMTAFVLGLPEHKVRVIAPDVGGGFGSKIYPLRRKTWRHLGVASSSTAPIKWTAERSEVVPLRRARPRPRHAPPSSRWTRTASSSRCACKTTANLGAYLSTFASCDADHPVRDAARRPVHDAGDLLRGDGGVHQHRAGRRLSRRRAGPRRPTWSSGSSSTAAREMKMDPAEIRRKNFITRVPVPDAGRAAVRHRRLRRRTLDKAHRSWPTSPASRRAREAVAGARASCAASATPATSRRAASRRRTSPARSARAPACSRRARSACIRPARVTVFTGSHSHGQGHETTFAQVVAGRLGIPVEQRRDRARRHRPQSRSAWAPTARARSRSAARRSSRRSTRSIAKGKKIAAHLLEAADGDIEFENGEFKVAGTDKKMPFGAGRAHRLRAAQLSARQARAGPERERVLRPDQLHLPGRQLHLRGRGRSARPARRRSSASPRSTTSATSSTR